MLTPDQLHSVLELLDRQLLFFAGSSMGPQVLNDQDKELLRQHGVNPETIYDDKKDLVNLNFHLGMLSNVLGQERARELDYEQLYKYIQSGQHIQLNKRELATVSSIKMQSMADIRATSGRIFQDINNVVGNELSTARANQEEFLREQISEGVISRQSRKSIASKIARLTGDWSRNFGKSVQYIAHTALNEGRAAMIHRRHEGNVNGHVYFHVQPTACKYCVAAYLTAGPGSAPKLFTLQELEANGTNIGRKAAEWLPVAGAMHINCRCLLSEYVEGQDWDGKRFVWPDHPRKEPGSARPKVRIQFNGQEYWV